MQQRSTQLLDKMAQRLSLTSEKTEETESSRPKFRKSVVELTEDCEYRKELEKQAQRRSTLGSGGGGSNLDNNWYRRASAASNSVVSSKEAKIDQDKEKLRQVIRLCMNTDYLQELDDAELQKERRNKVTYQRIGS